VKAKWQGYWQSPARSMSWNLRTFADRKKKPYYWKCVDVFHKLNTFSTFSGQLLQSANVRKFQYLADTTGKEAKSFLFGHISDILAHEERIEGTFPTVTHKQTVFY
jgi:hypothetical protein